MCILNVMSLYFLRLWVFFLDPERAWGFSRDRLFERRRYGGTFSMSCFFFFFFFFFQNFHSHSFCISHTPHRHPEPLIYQSPADSPSPFVQPANNNSNNKKHPQEDLYIYLALWESQCKYLLTPPVFSFFFFCLCFKVPTRWRVLVLHAQQHGKQRSKVLARKKRKLNRYNK